MVRRLGVVFAWSVVLVWFGLSMNCSKSGGISGGGGLNILVEPATLRFSNIAVFTEETQNVTVTHSGKEGVLKVTASLTSDTSDDFSIEGPEGSLTVEIRPGESATFKVTLKPTDAELDTGWVEIKHNVEGVATKKVRLLSVAPEQTLVVDPNPIDFGEVLSGQTKSLEVKIYNVGTDTITATRLELASNTSTDFKIENLPNLPIQIPSRTNISLTISYTPKKGGTDTGSLSIISNDPNNPELNVLILGTEPGPEISVSPGVLNFGAVEINQSKTITVTLKNIGTEDLVINKASLSIDVPKSVTIDNPPTTDTVLKPDDTTTFDVTFKPIVVEELKGTLVVDSTDNDEGRVQIKIQGRTAAPRLQVVPSAIDLGLVAQGLTKKANLTLFNAGELPLDISTLVLSNATGAPGEFEIVENNNFGPTSSTPTAGTLAPGESVIVEVTFTNEGASSGTETATIQITSNDPTVTGTTDVPVEATRGGSPTCDVVLAPQVLNFGIVPRGGSKDLQMNIWNKGSGNCTFVKAEIQAGAQYFKVTGSPPPVTEGMVPGSLTPVTVRFTPPLSASLFDFNNYNGCLFVTVKSPYGAQQQITVPTGCSVSPIPIPIPIPGQGQANLSGASGTSEISVLPSEIDFGLVRVGCASQQRKLTIYNAGTAPLQVDKIEPQNCGSEFKIFNLPILPIEVSNTQPVTIDVYYEPTDFGKDECTLLITSSDVNNANFVIPLKGEGTDTDHQVDEFVQLSGQKVDILFVVDNSGSMGDEQDNLVTNFSAMIKEAQKWPSDLQLGVVTVEIEDTNSDRGKLKGNPRIVIPGNPPDFTKVETQFTANIKVGTGYSGAQEAGLEAARIALSPPLITDTGLSCSTDSDCQGADLCVTGVCGGFNRGFLRKDATLVLVFVSDEEDQSPGSVPFYIDFFKNLKGFQNTGLLKVHAIVGPSGGCSNNFGSAAHGKRYIDVANATGGKVGSICDASFSTLLADIGQNAFGLQVQFFLTRAPIESTIKVTVDGVSNGDWTYDSGSTSIIFNTAPKANAKISIEYTAKCFQYN